MRFVTFSFLRIRNIKSIYSQLPRTFSSRTIQPKIDVDHVAGDPNLVEISESWKPDDEPELRANVLRDMRVLPNFVSEEEEASILKELEPRLKRIRYEYDHWDNAIEGYRETEHVKWSVDNEKIISRVKALAFRPGTGAGEPLPYVHVLDLAAGGHIKPHIDAVRFCGEVIAGLCLMSTAVMRLQHVTQPHFIVDALLQRRSLYIMRGVARYDFKHSVLGGGDSAYRGERVPRRRRLALICRSRPPPAAAATPAHTPPPAL